MNISDFIPVITALGTVTGIVVAIVTLRPKNENVEMDTADKAVHLLGEALDRARTELQDSLDRIAGCEAQIAREKAKVIRMSGVLERLGQDVEALLGDL